MATAQMMKTRPQQGTWSSIFPQEQVTETQSALFVKKLLAVSVSSITYLRTIFPEHAFGDRCLEDLTLKILKDDSACPGACQVIQWVKGCFDALDKKYLRSVVIAIYEKPEDPETIIESYTFKFHYGKDGMDIYRNGSRLAGACTEGETKKATIKLLRTLLMLSQTLGSLPDDVMMTMKLYYYEKVTPADYQPPGFTSCNGNEFKFAEEPVNIKVGDVATQFHMMKLRIKTDANQFDMKEEFADNKSDNEVEEEPQIAAEEKETSSGEEVEVKDKADQEDAVTGKDVNQDEMECDDVPPGSPALPSEEATTDFSQSEIETNVEEVEPPKVRCSCECNEDDGLMVLCGVCEYWQHGVCFGILDEEEAPDLHICVICSKDPKTGKACTDPSLVDLSPVELQGTCLWRRALQACSEAKRILPKAFATRLGVESNVAFGLINKLEREGFVRHGVKGKRFGRYTVKEKFKNNGLRKIFDDLQKEKKKTSTGKESQKEASKSKEEQPSLEKITQKASKLNISGKKDSVDTKKGSKSLNVDTRCSPRLRSGRKRAVSQVDDSAEFEISNSQCEMSQEPGRSKRFKASIAVRPILV